MRIALFVTLSALLLSGCGGGATVSEHQCLAGDWQTLGYRDGVNGQRSTALLAHQDACGEHGIVPDRHGYMLGWKDGVREFSEPHNGFAVGERGQAYYNVCPEDLRSDFLAGFQQGRTLYQARTAVAGTDRAIRQTIQHIEAVKEDIVATTAAQFSGTLLPVERLELLARTKQLSEEQGRLEVELVDLEIEYAQRQHDLDALTNSLAAVTL
jgi:hypothetical protein